MLGVGAWLGAVCQGDESDGDDTQDEHDSESAFEHDDPLPAQLGLDLAWRRARAGGHGRRDVRGLASLASPICPGSIRSSEPSGQQDCGCRLILAQAWP